MVAAFNLYTTLCESMFYHNMGFFGLMACRTQHDRRELHHKKYILCFMIFHDLLMALGAMFTVDLGKLRIKRQ